MEKLNITIKAIDNIPHYLPVIKALWRPNSATLGFFPDGAFNESALKGHILIAIDSKKECIGYLLYRISGEKIIIVHLCIKPSWRGKGIAKRLVNYLIQITKKYNGIGLNCRRDFPVNKIWPSLGFIAQNDKPGRSKKGSELTYWWFDHGNPNLFSTLKIQEETKVGAVIDANVFFDLYNDEKNRDESKALFADWLKPSLELFLTDEIFNEINRNATKKERNRQRNLAKNFAFVNCSEFYEEIFKQLENIFTKHIGESDQSDLRQLAKTIASGTQFFITRDEKILKKAPELNATFCVSIMRPADFITHLDELRRESEYQPARLAGTISFEFRRIQSGEEAEITQTFQAYKKREIKNEFQGQLRTFLADPTNFECSILNKNKIPYGLIVYDRRKGHELEIPIIRTIKDQLTSTVERYLVIRAVTIASQENRFSTKISDRNFDETLPCALAEEGFFNTGNGWMKINLSLLDTAENLAKNLNLISSKYDYSYEFIKLFIELLNRKPQDTHALSELEHYLWPVKVIDSEIPTYIVPIRPQWAEHLFDVNLAKENIFGSDPTLALRNENIYYRSKRGKILYPGRILWYVSSHSRYGGSGSIRACSRLNEILRDNPKNLFRKFKRLGVYSWKHVLKAAKDNSENELMAIKFSDTELFENPIPWVQLQKIFKVFNLKTNVMSPVLVSNNIFAKIYMLGKSNLK